MDRHAIIFYFSGTGNTKWVCKELANSLNHKRLNTKMISIEDIRHKNIGQILKNIDIVGFAYPIYGSDIPIPMKRFMHRFPNIIGKKIFVICTQETFSGDGTRVSKRFLKHTGGTIRWSEHFNMPNNITVTLTSSFWKTTSQDKVKEKLKKAILKIDMLSSHIVNDTTSLRGFHIISFILGCIQRVPFRMGYPFLKGKMSINDDRCSNCKICHYKCPTNNIILIEDKCFIRNRCSLCLRCYNHCPNQAIKFMNLNHNDKISQYKGPQI